MEEHLFHKIKLSDKKILEKENWDATYVQFTILNLHDLHSYLSQIILPQFKLFCFTRPRPFSSSTVAATPARHARLSGRMENLRLGRFRGGGVC